MSNNPNTFKVTLLGTASAMPVRGRNQSAQALQVHGRLFLIDCGEGVQYSMVEHHIPMMKLDSLFISHIHGDHCFGLFGLLSTMGLYHRTGDLHIYGPQNLGPILKFYLSYFGQDLGYEIVFEPLSNGKTIALPSLNVTAFQLNHKIDCYGFRFDEVVSPRRNPWKPRSYAYVSDTAPFPELWIM